MVDISVKIKEHTVMVGAGSGVLIQPMSDAFTYILTAKHVIETAKGSNKYISADDIEVETSLGIKIKIIDRIIDPRNDAAILITEQIVPSTLSKSAKHVIRNENVYLSGFPQTRRGLNLQDRIRIFPGSTTDCSDVQFLASLDNLPGRDQVVGVSGGGVFGVIGDEIFLYGVEFKMDGNPTAEHHGVSCCMPISIYSELLLQNDRPQIFNAYFECFTKLIDTSFEYSNVGTPGSIALLKSSLYEKIQESAEGGMVTPLQVHEKFKESMLIHSSSPQDMYDPKLWARFLEFLIISSCIDDQELIDEQYLENMHSKRRYLYSSKQGNWIIYLKDIYTSSLKGLKKGGVIVVSIGRYTNEPSNNTMQAVITDIGRVSKRALLVDVAIQNPANEFKLVHIDNAHNRSVVIKEDEYAPFQRGEPGLGVEELLAKFKGEYREFFCE